MDLIRSCPNIGHRDGCLDDYGPLTPRNDFNNAYDLTREMQAMLVAFHEGPRVLEETLGRAPTTVEMLRYARDELASKSPRATKQTRETKG
jgi:hypothetical protein